MLPVLTMKELANDPSLRASGTVVEVDHKARGKYLTVGSPIKFSDMNPRSPAPRCWASTPTRSSASLGYGTAEIAALHTAQAV